jgi:hypothetical protein
VDDFVRKGGALAETHGRQCVCNGLVATIGMAQILEDQTEDLPLLTAGNDLNSLGCFLETGRDSYSAAEVVRRLLAPA